MDMKKVSTSWEEEVESLWWKKQREGKNRGSDGRSWLLPLRLETPSFRWIEEEVESRCSPVPTRG